MVIIKLNISLLKLIYDNYHGAYQIDVNAYSIYKILTDV